MKTDTQHTEQDSSRTAQHTSERSESRFTPGPWEINFWHDTYIDQQDGELCIARLVNGNESDARLIAAAPELLEACEYALSNMEGDGYSEMILSTLRAALAKAKGGAL